MKKRKGGKGQYIDQGWWSCFLLEMKESNQEKTKVNIQGCLTSEQ